MKYSNNYWNIYLIDMVFYIIYNFEVKPNSLLKQFSFIPSKIRMTPYLPISVYEQYEDFKELFI